MQAQLSSKQQQQLGTWYNGCTFDQHASQAGKQSLPTGSIHTSVYILVVFKSLAIALTLTVLVQSIPKVSQSSISVKQAAPAVQEVASIVKQVAPAVKLGVNPKQNS